MKRFTLTFTVTDDYLYHDTQKRVKQDLAEAALLSAKNRNLDLASVEVRVGTVRKGK